MLKNRRPFFALRPNGWQDRPEFYTVHKYAQRILISYIIFSQKYAFIIIVFFFYFWSHYFRQKSDTKLSVTWASMYRSSLKTHLLLIFQSSSRLLATFFGLDPRSWLKKLKCLWKQHSHKFYLKVQIIFHCHNLKTV